MPNTPNQNTIGGIHPNSLIATKRGTIPIKYVVANDIVFDTNNTEITIKNNITLLDQTNQFVRITKNSLSKGIPKNDLYVKDNQKILDKNSEHICKTLINNTTIKRVDLFDSVSTHILTTTDASYIIVDNVPISTLNNMEWKKDLSKLKINFKKK